MKAGIIIQARNGSTRLPNKMVLPFYQGKGILETILIRLKKANLNVPIILATTINPDDQILEKIGFNQGVKVFRGSVNNVLARYIKAAKENGINKIIRICADNPFLDMEALKFQLDDFVIKEVDYWCYCKNDYTPTIKTHFGFWAEGVSLNALKTVRNTTKEKIYKEHVTNYLYTNSGSFNIHYQKLETEIEKHTDIRMTIDTITDFVIAQEIYSELISNNIPFNANHIINFVKANPRWINVMKDEISSNLK